MQLLSVIDETADLWLSLGVTANAKIMMAGTNKPIKE